MSRLTVPQPIRSRTWQVKSYKCVSTDIVCLSTTPHHCNFRTPHHLRWFARGREPQAARNRHLRSYAPLSFSILTRQANKHIDHYNQKASAVPKKSERDAFISQITVPGAG